MLSVLLNGGRGRMGRAIADAAASGGVSVVASVDAGDDFRPGLAACSVVIDFSLHAATVPLVKAAAAAGKPVVIGTTGHTAVEREAILGFTRDIPLVWAGNYSVGVNVLFWLTRLVSEKLGAGFDPEIVEMHHRAKVDAPSGTAERLVEQVLAGRGWGREAVCHGRSGLTGARPAEQVGVHAVRGGSVVGDHAVIFAGSGERLELHHRAEDRRIFAEGALRAAHWVVGREPGLYRMEDVLGLM